MGSPEQSHSPTPPGGPHASARESADREREEEFGADFSLETLGRLYAKAVGQRASGEHSVVPNVDATPNRSPQDPAAAETAQVAAQPTGDEQLDPVAVTPRSILEAILFVGSPDNAPLSARKAASMIRGVSPTEIDELVAELNRQYDEESAAYQIEHSDRGYRMTLRADLQTACARLAGQERPARLSQAAIEVLAVVAYHQPATAEEVDRLRNHHSSAILNQLVRRDLLAVHRDPHDKRTRRYTTTDRFLSLFGLDAIADLPQAEFEEDLELP